MNKKGKILSIVAVMALVLSLMAVIPAGFAGAQGTEDAEFLSYADLVGDITELDGTDFTDIDDFDGTEIGIDFVSVQSGGDGADFRGFNILTLKATVEDDNEALIVASENPEIEDIIAAFDLVTDDVDFDLDLATPVLLADKEVDLTNSPIDDDNDGDDLCDDTDVTVTRDGVEDTLGCIEDDGNPAADQYAVDDSDPDHVIIGAGTEIFDKIVVTFDYWDGGNNTFITQNTPLVDLDGNGLFQKDLDVLVEVEGVTVSVASATQADGTIVLDNDPDTDDTVEVQYAHSDTDSTTVSVTSSSEPTSAGGLALEVGFDGGDIDVSEDSDDFLSFFLLITDADEDTLQDVLRDDPLESGLDDIDAFIADVGALLEFDIGEDGCDPDDDGDNDNDDCIDLDGMEGVDWIYAAEGVVGWQELIATEDADVGLDDITDGTDAAENFFNLTLVVADGDTTTAEVGAAEDEVLADLTAPIVDVRAPVDGSISDDDDPSFNVRFTDPGSEDDLGSGIPLDDDNIDLVSDDGELNELDAGTIADNDFTVTGIDDGFRFKITLDNVDDGDFTWGAVIEDAVGNVIDTTGDFSFSIDTDAPRLDTAVTGLGVSDGVEVSDQEGIRVEFDGSIDAASLDEDDFDITGFSPPDAVANFDELERTQSFAGDAVFDLDNDALDTNDDDDVDVDDISILIETAETLEGDNDDGTGDPVDTFTLVDDVADANGDGSIDGDDITVVVDNFVMDVEDIDGNSVTLTSEALDGGDNITFTYSFVPGDEVGDDPSVDVDTFDGDILEFVGGALPATDTVSITYTFDASSFVYLTVEGLDPASQPDVSIVDDEGGIADLAGNIEDDIADENVTDLIGADLDITIGSLISDGEVLTITIVSDEELDSLDVTINGDDVSDELETDDNITWTLEVTGGDDDLGLDTSGFSLITVVAEDENGNITTVNLRGDDGLEVDLAINGGVDPVFDPVDDDVVRQGLDNIVRLSVTFDGEADEYNGDSRGGVDLTSAALGSNTIELGNSDADLRGTGTADSGQSGTATLTAVGEKTQVDISVTAGISGIQHIHDFTGGAIGGVVYGLGTIGDDGTSSTLVDATIEELRSGEFIINLHDADDASIYTSNGAIPAATDVLAGAFSDADQVEWGFGLVLAEGDYSLLITAEDEAGNEFSGSVDFAVEAPTTFIVDIDPGWNLISVPSRLDAASPQKVFGDTSPTITKVRTWSAVAGWQVSNFKDGAWSGDIGALKQGIGYWVFSETADDLDVTLRRIAGIPTAPRPQEVVAGWNLIGPQFFNLPPDVDVNAEDYLGEDATVWYGFDPDPAVGFDRTPDDLEAGKGYWVWFDADGQIIP